MDLATKHRVSWHLEDVLQAIQELQGVCDHALAHLEPALAQPRAVLAEYQARLAPLQAEYAAAGRGIRGLGSRVPGGPVRTHKGGAA